MADKTALEAAETRSQEFARLVGEYQHGDGSEKAEAWNLIADFAVDNAAVIRDALIAFDRRSPVPAPAETEEDRALANFDKIKDSFFASHDVMLSAPAEGVRDLVQHALDLLQEKVYGNPARSPGHNAQLKLKAALALLPSESAEKAGVVATSIDPIIAWMVERGWLDADAEYYTADLIAALNDNVGPAAPSPATGEA